MPTITKNGAEIVGEHFRRTVNVKAHNVTLRDCTFEVSSDDYLYAARANFKDGHRPFKGTRFLGCTIIGGKSAGLLIGESVVRYCTFRDQENDPIKIAGNNVWVNNCTMRDAGVIPPGFDPGKPGKRPHADGIHVMTGKDIAISENDIQLIADKKHFTNSAIYVEPLNAPIHRLWIYGNILNGGAYPITIKGQSGITPTDVHLFDNRFGEDWAHGYADLRVPVFVSGNTTIGGHALNLRRVFSLAKKHTLVPK